MPWLIRREPAVRTSSCRQLMILIGFPALVSLTAYRIVQEGLTNARKHGGSDVTVALDLGAGRSAGQGLGQWPRRRPNRWWRASPATA